MTAKKYKEIDVSFDEIWLNMSRYIEYIVVHVKPDLVPHILELETQQLYSMPEGLLEFLNKKYRNRYS